MKIMKQEQLNQHPILNQIPLLVWDLEFGWGFDDKEVHQLQDKSFDQVLREHLPESDIQAFIVLLAYYPLITPKIISFARDTLKLSEREIFRGIAVMGRDSALKAIFEQPPSSEWLDQIKDNFRYTFSLVAGCGQLSILLLFKNKLPRQYAWCVKENVVIYRAAQYNQLRVLQLLIGERPENEKEIVRFFSGDNLEDIAFNGSVDALKWIQKLDPEVFAQILAHTPSILARAAANGQRETCVWIKDQVSQREFHAMIEYDTEVIHEFTPLKYMPLRNAAKNGHLSTCQWIKEQVSDKKFEQMLQNDNHVILREVICYKQPAVFKWFNEVASSVVKDFLKLNEDYNKLMYEDRCMLQPVAKASDLSTSLFHSKNNSNEDLAGWEINGTLESGNHTILRV